MFDFSYLTLILKGATATIEIAIYSLIIATLLGLAVAFARLSKIKLIKTFGGVFVTVIRGVPELVLMLLLFFGGQILVNYIADTVNYEGYIDINPFVTGVIVIGIIYAAYMAETFRGAILSIEKGQIEAAESLAMSRYRILVRITIPQMALHALPGFTNNWLVLLKATALVSLIGLNDMVGVAEYASTATKSPFFYYLLIAFIYLAFTSLSLYLLKVLVRRYNLEQQN